MYFQLVKEKIKWEKCQNNMIREQRRKAKKRCMPFCYCPRGFVLKMVSSLRSRTTGKEETHIVATRGQKEERDSEGEVYQEQETSESYTYFS